MPASLLHENKYLVHTSGRYGLKETMYQTLPDLGIEHFCRILVYQFQDVIFPFFGSDWIDTLALQVSISWVNNMAEHKFPWLSELSQQLGANQTTKDKFNPYHRMLDALLPFIQADSANGYILTPGQFSDSPPVKYVPKTVPGGNDMTYFEWTHTYNR